jgi:hypothetical protein
MGGYDMTPNVIPQVSVMVTTSSHFLEFFGSLSSPEQKLWFPNQNSGKYKIVSSHMTAWVFILVQKRQ